MRPIIEERRLLGRPPRRGEAPRGPGGEGRSVLVRRQGRRRHRPGRGRRRLGCSRAGVDEIKQSPVHAVHRLRAGRRLRALPRLRGEPQWAAAPGDAADVRVAPVEIVALIWPVDRSTRMVDHASWRLRWCVRTATVAAALADVDLAVPMAAGREPGGAWRRVDGCRWNVRGRRRRRRRDALRRDGIVDTPGQEYRTSCALYRFRRRGARSAAAERARSRWMA